MWTRAYLLLHYKRTNVTIRYQELASEIERDVRRGRLRPGDLLPTVRSHAEVLGASPTTVAAAYRLLRQRGIVVGDGRRGTRVSPTRAIADRSPMTIPRGVRDLATGNPDPSLLPSIQLPVVESRLYGESPHVARLIELATAQFAADRVATDAVTVVGGALDGVERVLQSHLAPGDRVVVEDPGYTGVLDLLPAMGLVPAPVAVDGEGITASGLNRAIALGAKAVILTPRAQNPTGAALTEGRARTLRRFLGDVLVIEDDHAGAISGAPARSVAGKSPHWAVVRSVSKSLGPDLRVAVLAGDPTTVARVEARQRVGAGWVSHLLQHAVVKLWTDRGVQAQLRRATTIYGARRTALVQALRERGLPAFGASGLNVWMPVSGEQEVVAGLLERGWAVTAGERFRVRSEPGIRITTATLEPGEAETLAVDIAAVLRPGRLTRLG
jgi:DNA-binding transcriptional MocR family regulator